MKHQNHLQDRLTLPPGEGRLDDNETKTVILKTDENETDGKHSISEWWLEQNPDRPGAHHQEDNDEMFYILEGLLPLLWAISG